MLNHKIATTAFSGVIIVISAEFSPLAAVDGAARIVDNFGGAEPALASVTVIL